MPIIVTRVIRIRIRIRVRIGRRGDTHDTVGKGTRLVGVMRDEHDGNAQIVQMPDHAVQTVPRRVIQSRRGLVHDDELRPACQHTGDGDEPLLPAGQGERRTVCKMLDVQQAHGLLGPLHGLLLAQSLVARAVGDVFGNGRGEQLAFGVLHDVADRGVHLRTLFAFGAMHGNAVHHDRAGIRLGERAQDLRERGFAGAVGSHDGDGLAVADGERQVGNCRCGCAGVGVGEVFDGDQWAVRAVLGV